jgi:putative ABC transport system substrate-binding protein
MRRIGVLLPLPPEILTGFFAELRELGFSEDRNLAVDHRGFSAAYEKYPDLAAELVKANIDVLLCGGEVAVRAAQAATRTIPILAIADDMPGAGLVASLARPGGNTTGISILAGDLDSKRQEILTDLVPGAGRISVLSDARTNTPAQIVALQAAARTRSVELSIHSVERSEEIAPAIDTAKAAGAAALNVLASPLLHENVQTIMRRTEELRMPAIYQWPEIAEQGGLIAYGPRFSEIFRQWARQLARILAGTKPADIPVEQPTKFELVINLRTAKALGLEMPPTLLARSDKTIE